MSDSRRSRRKCSSRAACVDHVRQEVKRPGDSSVLRQGDVASIIVSFARKNDHIFTAGVCKEWRSSWSPRVKITSKACCAESRSRIAACETEVSSGDIAASGAVDVMEWYCSNGYRLDDSVCRRAARNGHLDMLKWCRGKGCGWDEETMCNEAATGCNIELLEWCMAEGCPLKKEVMCNAAAEGGSIVMMKWCRAQGCNWGAITLCRAMGKGHFALFKWCVENGCPVGDFGLNHAESAAKGGSLGVLGWFKAQDWNTVEAYSQILYEDAAKAGHLTMLKWLHKMGCRINPDWSLCGFAAEGGSTEVMSWCRSHGCCWNEAECRIAAEYGHLALLKWCRKHGCEWNSEEVCKSAAEHGRFAVLRWAKENGANWNEHNICEQAMYGGSIEAVSFCVSQGADWEHVSAGIAATQRNLPLLRWCKEHNFKWDESLMCRMAAFGGSIEVMEWCREQGCPWHEVVCTEAACPGHLDLLKWLKEHGCPWEEERICYDVVSANDFFQLNNLDEILSWCQSQGCTYNP